MSARALLTGAEWQMLDEVRAAGGRLTYPGLRLRQTAEVLQRAGLVKVKIHARKGDERGEGPHSETITVSEVPSDMGRRLREARLHIGLSQGRLAERVGASRTTIARLEESAGKHSPSVDLALAVAGEVGQSVESLWGPTEPVSDVAPNTRASWRKLAEAEQDKRLDDASGGGRR